MWSTSRCFMLVLKSSDLQICRSKVISGNDALYYFTYSSPILGILSNGLNTLLQSSFSLFQTFLDVQTKSQPVKLFVPPPTSSKCFNFNFFISMLNKKVTQSHVWKICNMSVHYPFLKAPIALQIWGRGGECFAKVNGLSIWFLGILKTPNKNSAYHSNKAV